MNIQLMVLLKLIMILVILKFYLRIKIIKKMVKVEIQDNGKGIPDDVLPYIFDPFYTTKPIGEGTGMGLSISYKIIQEHGGQILVESVKEVGTAFTILLPLQKVSESMPVAAIEPEMASEGLFAD